jgi:dTDP-4-dehydrorhamnose reductase
MIILISGGEGKFAKELIKQNIDHTIIPLSKYEMDITDLDSVNSAINLYKPDIFIHNAALSRPMKLHEDNPEKGINLNIIGTSNCVMSCIKYGVKIVYISTDYVYPGKKGQYSEIDGVYPVNKYAWSKLGGECAVMMYDNSLILRMAMIEYPFPHSKAFTDLYKSNIWNFEAAKIVFKLIERNATGIFNIGEERKSIYDFVSQKDFSILKYSKNDIRENTPDDISMNLKKLQTLLNNDTTI